MMQISRNSFESWLILQFYFMFSYSSKPEGYQSAYQPAYQSALDLNARKTRVLSSTTGFNPKEVNPGRLPQLTRSFSTSKSTKLKLTTIEATLAAMDQDLHQLKSETRESRRFCNFLKDDLGESKLGMLKLELQTTVNKFDKMFKMSKKHDEDRSQQIKVDSDRARESSKKLVKMMALLQSKIDNCERVMGISSGKEKHLK